MKAIVSEMSVDTMMIVAQWAIKNRVIFWIHAKEECPTWTITLCFSIADIRTPSIMDWIPIEEFKKYRKDLLLPCRLEVVDDSFNIIEVLEKHQYSGDNCL